MLNLTNHIRFPISKCRATLALFEATFEWNTTYFNRMSSNIYHLDISTEIIDYWIEFYILLQHENDWFKRPILIRMKRESWIVCVCVFFSHFLSIDHSQLTLVRWHEISFSQFIMYSKRIDGLFWAISSWYGLNIGNCLKWALM